MWEKKLEAYERIVNSLYNVITCYNGLKFHLKTGGSDSEVEKNLQKLSFTMETLLNYRDTGALILPEKLILIIKVYGNFYYSNDWEKFSTSNDEEFEKFLYGIIKQTEFTLENFIKLAKKDLNNSSWKKLLDKLPSWCSCKN